MTTRGRERCQGEWSHASVSAIHQQWPLASVSTAQQEGLLWCKFHSRDQRPDAPAWRWKGWSPARPYGKRSTANTTPSPYSIRYCAFGRRPVWARKSGAGNTSFCMHKGTYPDDRVCGGQCSSNYSPLTALKPRLLPRDSFVPHHCATAAPR